MESASKKLSRLLEQSADGDPAAGDELSAALYDELRALAHHRLRREDQATWQTTELVHETYLRLSAHGGEGWNHRGHFFGAAAQAMRRILVEQARKRRAEKRGGGRQPTPLDSLEIPAESPPVDLLELDEALNELQAKDPRLGQVVLLRYFAGLDGAATARELGISERTLKRDWATAKAWLWSRLGGSGGTEQP